MSIKKLINEIVNDLQENAMPFFIDAYEPKLTHQILRKHLNRIDEKFKEGDIVFTYGFGYERYKGTIHKNTDNPEVSEWYIKYDDGEECAVLDIDSVCHLDNE